jgi:hypothetical protein
MDEATVWTAEGHHIELRQILTVELWPDGTVAGMELQGAGTGSELIVEPEGWPFFEIEADYARKCLNAGC